MRESDRIYGGRTAASGGIGRKVGETRKNSWRGGSRSRVSAGEGLQGTATRHEWKMEQGFTEKHPPPAPPQAGGAIYFQKCYVSMEVHRFATSVDD